MPGDFDEIINSVLDDQVPAGKTQDEAEMMRLRGEDFARLGGGGGGGSNYTAKGLAKKWYNDLTGKTYQPQSPLKEPPQPLPGQPAERYGYEGMPQAYVQTAPGTSVRIKNQYRGYGPMNRNKRFEVIRNEEE